jgi:WD40 repeat protein
MADVFVSYSRRDSEFVGRMVESIEGSGKEVWLDTEGLVDGEVFPPAIRRAIEQADSFLFVITPAAVESPFCESEVDYASDLHKRIVPVLRAPVADDQLPAEIRDRNWIPFTERDPFEPSMERLITALERDPDHLREHTRWLVKALEWEREGHDRSFLLRGSELKAADAWLATVREGADPPPSSLQRRHLLASREAAARRQRALVGASLAVAIVSIGLLVFALISRGQAVSARDVANSRALAAESQSELAVDPQLSILLATQAVRTSATPDALFALRAAIDGSPLRMTLRTAAQVGCQSQIGPSLAYDPSAPLLAEGLCGGQVEIGRPTRGRILVFDTRTGRIAQRLTSGFGGAPALAYSPDGSVLAAGTATGIRLLDASTGATQGALGVAGGGPLSSRRGELTNALTFSANGSQLAVVTQTQAELWSLSRHSVVTLEGKPFPTNGTVSQQPAMHAAVFTPDGGSVVVAGTNGVRVFRARTGAPLRALPGTGPASAVAVSPDGRELAVATTAAGQGVVTLWNVRTWTLTSTLAHFAGRQITTVAFSPDGDSVAIGAADGSAGLWSIRSGDEEAAYAGSTSSVASIVFAPGGGLLATASADGTTDVWRASGPQLASIDAGGTVYDAQLNGDRVIAALAPGVVSSWSLREGGIHLPSITTRVAGVPTGLVLSQGGSLAVELLAAQPGGAPTGAAVFSTRTGALVRKVPVPPTLSVTSLSADGRMLALIAEPSRFVTLATGRSLTLAPLPGPPPAVSGCQWVAAAVSDNDRLVAGADFCGKVVVWDTTTGRIRASFTNQGEISHIAFSPDGRSLAVASWDSTITIWDVLHDRPSRALTGDTLGVNDVAYSPDGALLASSSLDDTARVWDPSSGRLLRVWREQQPLESVAFSSDGSRLVTSDAAGTISVWDACTACGSAGELLAIARTRVTRGLTPLERATFLGS